MLQELKFYGSLFRRRLGWFVLSVLMCGAIGIAVAVGLPPVYVASAKLVVEAEKIPDELAASTVRTEGIEHLHIIQQRILSRDALIDMADRLGIFPAPRPAPDQIVASLRSRIKFNVEGGVATRRSPAKATILTLGFEADTGIMAATVVNELVTAVLAEDVDMRTTVARQTVEFFDQEVSRLQQQLSKSGATLLSFRQENNDVLPQTRDVRIGRIQAIEAQLLNIEAESADLTRERERLTRLHETVARREGRAQGGYEARQVAALKDTLRKLPDGDPAIEDIERRITSLSRRLEAETGRRTDRTAFHRHRDDIDARLAENGSLSESLREELEGLQLGLAVAPVKAAELASLERDHDNLRSLYDNALQAKALAETGDAIESLSKGQRVAVIEQAATPRNPARPDRGIVAMGGVGAGFALGLVIVILLEARLGFLRRPKDLERRLGITPIATLPIIETAAEIAAQSGRSVQRRLALAAAVAISAGMTVAVVKGYLPGPTEVAARIQSFDIL